MAEELFVWLDLIASSFFAVVLFCRFRGDTDGGNLQGLPASLHASSVICHGYTCITIEKNHCKELEVSHPPDLDWVTPLVSLQLGSCMETMCRINS